MRMRGRTFFGWRAKGCALSGLACVRQAVGEFSSPSEGRGVCQGDVRCREKDMGTRLVCFVSPYAGEGFQFLRFGLVSCFAPPDRSEPQWAGQTLGAGKLCISWSRQQSVSNTAVAFSIPAAPVGGSGLARRRHGVGAASPRGARGPQGASAGSGCGGCGAPGEQSAPQAAGLDMFLGSRTCWILRKWTKAQKEVTSEGWVPKKRLSPLVTTLGPTKGLFLGN